MGRVRAEQSYTGLGHIWSNPLAVEATFSGNKGFEGKDLVEAEQ